MNFAKVYADIQRIELAGTRMPDSGVDPVQERMFERRIAAASKLALAAMIENDPDELAALLFLTKDVGRNLGPAAERILRRVIAYRRPAHRKW
jgi:hypothetical protein